MTVSYLSAFLQGARFRVLPIIALPVLMSSAVFFHRNNEINIMLLVCTVVSAIFLQLSLNFADDAMDFKTGLDMTKRASYARVTQTGAVPFSVLLSFAFFCSAMSVLVAIPLILRGGLPVLLCGLVFLVICYFYNGYSFSMVRLGLAELICLIFFGPAIVMVTYYIQALEWDWSLMYLGIQCGLWATSILLVDYVRDEKEDLKAYRKNIVTVYGRTPTLFTVGIFQLCIYFFSLYWLGTPLEGSFLSSIMLIPSCILFYFICITPPSPTYNWFITLTANFYILFAALWITGLFVLG